MSTEVDKVFRGVPFYNVNLNRSFKPQILCVECRRKFKEFLKAGGETPKACDVCKKKLEDQMFSARHPDRT
jgi:rRNA maturation endonuclease Nob1